MLKPRYDAIGRCVGSKNVPAKLDLIYGNPWAPACLRYGDVPNAQPLKPSEGEPQMNTDPLTSICLRCDVPMQPASECGGEVCPTCGERMGGYKSVHATVDISHLVPCEYCGESGGHRPGCWVTVSAQDPRQCQSLKPSEAISEAFGSFWQCEDGQDEEPDKEVAQQAFRSGVEWGRNNPYASPYEEIECPAYCCIAGQNRTPGEETPDGSYNACEYCLGTGKLYRLPICPCCKWPLPNCECSKSLEECGVDSYEDVP